MVVEEDSGLLYPIFLGCVILIIAYFIYKLYSKVNELSEQIQGLKQQIDVKAPEKQLEPRDEETPKLEELAKELAEDPPKDTSFPEDPSGSKD